MDLSYQTLLGSKLNPCEFFLVQLLLKLLQTIKDVKLEQLAQKLPLPILMESRRRKLQRFLTLPHWNVPTIWWPILMAWIEQTFKPGAILYLTIDRTQWCTYNLLVVSLFYQHRGIPIHFQSLDKLGSSNYHEQVSFLGPVIELLSDYKVVLLGDREFCGVDLAQWLRERKASIALRLKKNEYIELTGEVKTQLSQLGIRTGERCFFPKVKVTQSKGFGPINVAASNQDHRRANRQPDAWYIMSDLSNLEEVLVAYSYRMGIEEMFRDWKGGGYRLEGTKLTGRRFISLMLLLTLAYYTAILKGERVQHQNIHGYVVRQRESGRRYRRHSAFAIGLSACHLAYLGESFWDLVMEYISFTPKKLPYYKRGVRAMRLAMTGS